MEVTTITCDGCGADLTTTSNCEDYRLGLVVESIASWGGVVTAMAKSVPLKRNHHFCGAGCLDHWSDRRRHKNKLSWAAHEEWKEKHRTKFGEGSYSYPLMPEEDRKRQDAEFEATALEAFPMQKPKRKWID